MESLCQRSIEIILENQSPTGAYYACPNFPTYRYSWFRDGSFCAYALDLFEQNESANCFYQWSIGTINRYQNKLQHCIQQATAGIPPTLETAIHARFTPDGEEIPGHWGNHQLDGLGTWLWAICEHINRTTTLPRLTEWLPASRIRTGLSGHPVAIPLLGLLGRERRLDTHLYTWSNLCRLERVRQDF